MKPSLFITALFCFVAVCNAGPVDEKALIVIPQKQGSPFDAGTCEIDFSGSFFRSPLASTRTVRPTYNWAECDASWGWMLNSPTHSGWLRGNFEFLANPFGAAVTDGPGSYMTGARALVRYNFVQPEANLIPFFQIGGGGLTDDAFHDRSQRALGGGFEFTLVADAGLRYFVSKNWALLALCDFQHISNAGMHARNLGVNGIGVSLGAGYFF